MLSWLDLGAAEEEGRVWSDSYVSEQLGERWCHSPRECVLEKGQLWRRMGVNNVSRGKKEGRWPWDCVFGP